MRLKLLIAVLLLSVLSFGSGASRDRQLAPTSGTVMFFQDVDGTITNQFELLVQGTAPASLTVTVVGCMRGGTCSGTLATSSGTTNQVLTTNPAGLWDSYKVTVAWTGGDATTNVAVNRTGTIAKNTGVGGGTGNVSTNGTPSASQIAVWSPDGTHITGYANATCDASGNCTFNSLTGIGAGALKITGPGASFPALPGAGLDGIAFGSTCVGGLNQNDAWSCFLRDIGASVPTADLKADAGININMVDASGDLGSGVGLGTSGGFLRRADIPDCPIFLGSSSGLPNCNGLKPKAIGTATYTIISSDLLNPIQCTVRCTLTLPAPSGAFGAPWAIYIDQTIQPSNATIDANTNGATINGSNTLVIPPGVWAFVYAIDTTHWRAQVSGIPITGVRVVTSSDSSGPSDNGKLVVMNCGSACSLNLNVLVLPSTMPFSWHTTVMNVSSQTTTMLGPCGVFNTSGGCPFALPQYQAIDIFGDGTGNFWTPHVPFTPGTNVTFTPGPTGIAINSSASGASGSSLLNYQKSAGAITGTGAIANIYQYTIPANTVGAGKCARFYVQFSHAGTTSTTFNWNVGGSAANPPVGGTNLNSWANAGAANGGQFLYLCNDPGVTNANSAIQIQSWQGASDFGGATTTTALDMTLSQVITFTFNVAASDSVTPRAFIAELLQ